MMKTTTESMLLVGESGVGKTHYGAQLLKRLLNSEGRFRMNGAATNLEAFEATMESLNDGRSAAHTPTSTYVDSEWPIVAADGSTFTLVWPDYGGEQIKTLLNTRRVPSAWRERVTTTSAWMLMLRLHQLRVSDDLLSKPLVSLADGGVNKTTEDKLLQISDQARMIELLQILLYLRGDGVGEATNLPQLCLLLSCWDELGKTDPPAVMLKRHLPMLSEFITTNWTRPIILGLSALERPLDKTVPDEEYITRGPEQFGYIVLPDGRTGHDLTFPLTVLLESPEEQL
jgi:hypothetical protein